MGWAIDNSNALTIKVGDDRYALAMVLNADGDGLWWLMLCKYSGGQWMNVTPQALNKAAIARVNDAQIMAYGSVAAFLQAMLQEASTGIKNLLVPVKPDPNNKGACVGYDLAYPGCVGFDTESMQFSLKMSPPLPHAR